MSFEVRFGLESGITYDAVIKQIHERWGDKIAHALISFCKMSRNTDFDLTEGKVLAKVSS